MTLTVSAEGRPSHRAEQVERLRRQMASVSEKMAGKGGGNHRAAPPSSEPVLGQDSLLPMPDSLVELLPDSLPRGTVAVLSGARSLQLSMVAAVTAEGGHAAIIGRARAVVARARQRGCTLLVTDGDWQGASARLDAHVSGYEVVGAGRGTPTPGCGRIGRVRLAMRSRGRSGVARAVSG